MDTTLEFASSSSTSWCGGLLDSDVGCIIFPNSGDSSATPASSSVAVVHLWPKVSTESLSSHRFLSVLPFNLQFCGRSHLIPLPYLSQHVLFEPKVHRLPTTIPTAPGSGHLRPSPTSVSTCTRSPSPPLSVPCLGWTLGRLSRRWFEPASASGESNSSMNRRLKKIRSFFN
jgi:hypothetical protein